MHRLQVSSSFFCLNIFIFLSFSFSRVSSLVLHLRKNEGLRRQAASHLQHPRGPAEVSRLLSVSEARVWSVDMEEMSLMEEEGGRLSLLFTAAPVLRESTAAGGLQRKKRRRGSRCTSTADMLHTQRERESRR